MQLILGELEKVKKHSVRCTQYIKEGHNTSLPCLNLPYSNGRYVYVAAVLSLRLLQPLSALVGLSMLIFC